MAEDQNISGLEFTVTNSNVGEGIKMSEDEWLPCILTEISKFTNQWGEQLRWTFELEGEEYTWKSKDGKSGQFKVSGSSSKACSPKSKLYKWYSKLMGKEPIEGETISLKNILGMKCMVMIKINHGKDKEGNSKDYYNVDKVKVNGGVTSNPAVAPIGPATVKAPTQQVTVPVTPVTPSTNPIASTQQKDIF